MVHDVVRAVTIPVIGMGGISSGDDALEFLLVGARAVQVGTASFTDPRAIERIVAELRTRSSPPRMRRRERLDRHADRSADVTTYDAGAAQNC